MQTRRLRLGSIILLLGLVLSACTPPPVKQEKGPDPDLVRAEALLAQEDWLGAARLFETLARRTPGNAGTEFLLRAAEASLKGGDLEGAETRLNDIENATPSARQRQGVELLHAELALARHQADQALEILLGMIGPDMPIDLQQRHLRDLANAYRQIGNLLESANTLQQLDELLEDREARLEVQSEILASLTALNERTLRELRPVPPGVAGGWMDLALLIKQYGTTPEKLGPMVAAWRTTHPDHPALPELLERYMARLAGQIEPVDHIAVLLPETGRYAAAARAIRDGLMISLYELPEEQRPLLRFYDSSDPADAWPLYAQAVAAGAQAVIGPLQKPAVEQLVRAGELAIPVLALNKVNSDVAPPEKLFMFSLDPEHEARLAAERIWQDGHRRPVVLVPNDAYGERLARAFTERWQTLTGYEADIGRYDPTSADHSATISALLQLDRSKARHRRLESWLGQQIAFEPRRRADTDAVFLVATPGQAQGIKPQLAFFRASDLPVYATSRAWSGHLTRRQLADMRGILLPDIPLIVNQDERQRLGALIPGVLGPAVRLHALGIDALRLQPHLRRLRDTPWESLDGQTGNLYMTPERQIERQLLWIELDEPPRVLGYSRRMDLLASPETSLPDSPAPQAAPLPQGARPPAPAPTAASTSPTR